MKTKKIIIIWILVLVLIDQSIKLLINAHFREIHFEIIPSLLEFKPTFNIKHSWINTLLNKNLGVNIGLLPHILLYLLIGILLPLYLSYFKRKIRFDKKLISLAIVFLVATIICALIGNIIWRNGTLDYIYLKPLFIFDLKDMYADFGIVVFLIYAFKNRVELEKSLKGVRIKDVCLDTKNRLKEVRQNN